MSGFGRLVRALSVSPTDPALPPVGALPSGARDVLPVEAAELRAVENALRSTFARYGYREIRTPVVEFAHQLERAESGGLERAYRLFDEAGRVLVLRPDMTIPVARLIATRGMSVRETEKLAKRADRSGQAAPRRARAERSPGESADIAAVQAHLEEFLGLKVTISADADPRTGAVTIRYKTLDQLDLICQRLTGGAI